MPHQISTTPTPNSGQKPRQTLPPQPISGYKEATWALTNPKKTIAEKKGAHEKTTCYFWFVWNHVTVLADEILNVVWRHDCRDWHERWFADEILHVPTTMEDFWNIANLSCSLVGIHFCYCSPQSWKANIKFQSKEEVGHGCPHGPTTSHECVAQDNDAVILFQLNKVICKT